MTKKQLFSACAGVVLAFNNAVAFDDRGASCPTLGLTPDRDVIPMDFMRRDGKRLTGQIVMTCTNRAIVDEYPGKREIVHDRIRGIWVYVVTDRDSEGKLKRKEDFYLSDSQADVPGAAPVAYGLREARATSDRCTTYHDVLGKKNMRGYWSYFFKGTMTFCRSN